MLWCDHLLCATGEILDGILLVMMKGQLRLNVCRIDLQNDFWRCSESEMSVRFLFTLGDKGV